MTNEQIRQDLHDILKGLVRVPVDYRSPVLTKLVDYVEGAIVDTTVDVARSLETPPETRKKPCDD